ncbi:MAG: bifunctional adenosylcobinamide kinase/adenosylcobinamide-phosphate guanylyltransferase [Thermovirga sp.]|nr:bifunctional adenosylcobinamide kinase/adenosylcobinamide-phosphate guanylyltransferase [Thermovirga sp.]
MERGKLILVTGGARSGKSSFAEKLAKEANKDVTYLATCQALDEEMALRIEEHKKRRPKNWKTIEEPLNASSVIEKEGKSDRVILLDCLALLVANLIFSKGDSTSELIDQAVLNEIKTLAKISKDVPASVIIVTNEVGMGIVPEFPLGRAYRDTLGKANQILASEADEVYLLVCGIPVNVKQLQAITKKNGM